MDLVTRLIDGLLAILAVVFGFLMAVFAIIETWLRQLMDGVGVPGGLQTVTLVVAGVLFLLLVLRSLGGFLRIVLVLLLVLLLIHVLLPLAGH